MQKTQVLSLGWEDPLEKDMATHSSILAWRIPWTEKPDGLQSTGLQKSRTLSSVQFSRSVMSDSLRPHESQHARPPCPLPIPGVHPAHVHRVSDAIQQSHPLSSPYSPASNPSQHQSFPMSQLFAWGGQSIGVSALVSVLPKKSQDWCHKNDWLDLLAVQGTLKRLLQQHSSKVSILWRSAFFTVQLSHSYMTTGKSIALTRWTFVGKVMSLLLNMLSRLFITFLPRSKRLLISWLHSPSAVSRTLHSD